MTFRFFFPGFWRGWAAAFLIILLAGCATGGAIKADSGDSPNVQEESSTGSAQKDVPPPAELKYTLGAGDTLTIKVYRQSDLDMSSVSVEPDGRVSLPLAGELYVEGLTMPEFRKLVESKLSKYIIRPQVVAYVNKVNSQKVFVLGEVGSPGVIRLDEKLTLLSAILRTGGPNSDANTDHVFLVRQGKAYDIDLGRIYRRDTKYDVPLANGDIVYVPPTGLADWGRVFTSIGRILSPIITLESGIVLSQSVERVLRGESDSGPSVSIPAQ